jgi:hypothetical protein
MAGGGGYLWEDQGAACPSVVADHPWEGHQGLLEHNVLANAPSFVLLVLVGYVRGPPTGGEAVARPRPPSLGMPPAKRPPMGPPPPGGAFSVSVQ